MNSYALRAKLPGKPRRTRTFLAGTDFEATCTAISKIMRLAHEEQEGAWALGEIELLAPDGTVLHRMDAKVPA